MYSSQIFAKSLDVYFLYCQLLLVPNKDSFKFVRVKAIHILQSIPIIPFRAPSILCDHLLCPLFALVRVQGALRPSGPEKKPLYLLTNVPGIVQTADRNVVFITSSHRKSCSLYCPRFIFLLRDARARARSRLMREAHAGYRRAECKRNKSKGGQ